MHPHPYITRALVKQHQEDLIRLAGRRRRRRPGAAPFLAGPEGPGARVYLTGAETRQFFAEWERLLARFAERRSAGASQYELVVLGRRTDA
jgi:hypothetical protein